MSININPKFTFIVNSFNTKTCNYSTGNTWNTLILWLGRLILFTFPYVILLLIV